MDPLGQQDDRPSTSKPNPKGKFVSSRQKRMISNSYKSKPRENPKRSLRLAQIMVSKELGIGMKKIFKNVADKVEDFVKKGIRRHVHRFWVKRELPSLKKILRVVNEDDKLPEFSSTTLLRVLKSMGFQFTKTGRNSALAENDEIRTWRRRYIRDIRKYREEGRPIYYCIDVTWLKPDTSSTAISQGLSTGAVNPTGKGKRLIFWHIGSEDGFVPGSLLCLESKKNTNDDHDEMNGDSFRDWLEGVLPKLKDNAVIVMDNAPYHSVKIPIYPTSNWRKADIIEWLQSKGEFVDPTMIIPELLAVVRRIKPLYNKCVIDEMALQQGKTVLRLPPYHFEFNPMDLAWSVVRDHVKQSNKKTFNLPDAKNILVDAVEKVDAEMWKNFISHTIKDEETFWTIDDTVDEMTAERNNLNMTVGNSDTEDDDCHLFSD